MRSIAKDREISQLFSKEYLDYLESLRLMVYAIFLSFVGEALRDEETNRSHGLELKHKLISSDIDPYRASGSNAIFQLSKVCEDFSIGRAVNSEYLHLGKNILKYIINPREAILKEV